MGKNEIVAMILAGGQGSRLGCLTKKLAKPAVPFGGKYRIIDFTLSNCSNSGIDTVGVLTQYKPLELNTHIGTGEAWDFNRKYGGVSILPPYQEEKGGQWYKGTANAIYQNIEFVDEYDPEYILILSGDHIYKMDYAKMLDFHKEKKSDATIAVIEVPMNEASRFGIMSTREDLSIYEFQEKPKSPKNNLASMGIYIFNWKILKKYLIRDEADKTSKNDFGMNIIPSMMKDGNKMFAYQFKGYWKDVGTIDSLWEANMDLLKADNRFDLYDEDWKIYSVNKVSPAQYIGENARISNSLIVEGCVVNGHIENSILFQGVKVGKNSVIRDSIIMTDAVIEDNVIIEKAIIGCKSIVKKDCRISLGDEIAIIPTKEEVKAGTVIESNKAV